MRAYDNATATEPARLGALYHGLDPADYPATITVADHLPNQTPEEEFQLGLDLIIQGLAQRRTTA